MGAGSIEDGDSQHQTQFTINEEFACLMQDPMPGYIGVIQDVTPPLQHQQFNSCPALIPSGGYSMANVPSGRKKQASKPAAPKPRMSRTTPVLIDDDVEGEDGGTTCRWSEEEVQQLIAFHQELDEKFEWNAKKQGVNMWERVQGMLVAVVENFQKSAEACRKKWTSIYNAYKMDKRLLQVSGEGRKIACKYFGEIDQGFNNRANVKKLAHGDSRGTPNPCSPDGQVAEDGPGLGEHTKSKTLSQGSNPCGNSPQYAKGSKKSSGEIVSTSLVKLVGHTTSIASEIHESNEVLRGLWSDLQKMIEKL